MSGIILNDGIQKYNLTDLLDYCGLKSPQQKDAFIELLKYSEVEFEFLLEPRLQVLDIANGLNHIANTLQKKYVNKKLDPEIINPLLLIMRMPHKPDCPHTNGILRLTKHIKQRMDYLWADLMSSTVKVHLGCRF